MKDFKIEYRDGKLLECRVDGVLVECLSSLHLIHEGRDLPTLTITTHVSSKETLIAPDIDRKTLESVMKRFGEGDLPFGGYPNSIKHPHLYQEGDKPNPPDDAA